MLRRRFLAGCGVVAAVGAGCLGTGDLATSGCEGTSDGCPRSPTVGDLPGRPERLTPKTVREFLADYEYRLASARLPDDVRVNYVEHVRTTPVAGGYRVHFFVEPRPESTTRGTTPTTETPAGEATYTAAYFIDPICLYRATSAGPTAHTGLRPREDGALISC